MALSSILALMTALAVFAAVPDPGMTSVVSCALGCGFFTAAALVVGIVLGDLAYLLLALFGLDLVARSFGSLFLAVTLGGPPTWSAWAYRSGVRPPRFPSPAGAPRAARLGAPC